MTRSQEMLASLDAYIQDGMQQWEIPGLALAVVKDDEIVLCRGFGTRKLGEIQHVDGDSLFAIGSNTKAFTTLALGLLVQDGRLSWDDLVIRHLPGFEMYDPYVTREIRVRDLLCHRSGLSTWGGDLMSIGSTYDRTEVVRRARYIPPATGLRYEYGYSNLMFAVAGEMFPALTGLSWEDFIHRRIFEPLGMARSCTSIRDLEHLDNVARPHARLGGQVRCVPYRNVDNDGPAGSINSSASDMVRWLRLLLADGIWEGQQLVEPSILDETRSPHTPLRIPPEGRALIPSRHFLAYGLGWFLMDYHGRMLVFHGGGIDGMLSQVVLVPEEKLGIVVLTNKEPHSFASVLYYHIVDAFLGVPFMDWNGILFERDRKDEADEEDRKKKMEQERVMGTRLTLPLEGYAGTYTNDIYGEASIVLKDGGLILHLSAHPDITGALKHWHYDAFLCRWSDPIFDKGLVPFILDGQGTVEAFRLKVREDMLDPLEYEFRRKDGML
jgi:CubicO group peptidase (beta-lactamase class C family)